MKDNINFGLGFLAGAMFTMIFWPFIFIWVTGGLWNAQRVYTWSGTSRRRKKILSAGEASIQRPTEENSNTL